MRVLLPRLWSLLLRAAPLPGGAWRALPAGSLVLTVSCMGLSERSCLWDPGWGGWRALRLFGAPGIACCWCPDGAAMPALEAGAWIVGSIGAPRDVALALAGAWPREPEELFAALSVMEA